MKDLVHTNGAGKNGLVHRPSSTPPSSTPPSSAPPSSTPPSSSAPPAVKDLAEACVQFVERALGVRLDYEPETLSILDHYLGEGRQAAGERLEAAALVAHAAGAYFGEVVRRRYPSWWRVEGDDPGAWRLEFEQVYLSFSPIQLVADALLHGSPAAGEAEAAGDEAGERFELEEADRAAVAARLANLPAVPEAEFYAPSTRLEVIDIIVDAARARRMAEGEEADASFGPHDYEG
jgi:hypothetical protein